MFLLYSLLQTVQLRCKSLSSASIIIIISDFSGGAFSLLWAWGWEWRRRAYTIAATINKWRPQTMTATNNDGQKPWHSCWEYEEWGMMRPWGDVTLPIEGAWEGALIFFNFGVSKVVLSPALLKNIGLQLSFWDQKMAWFAGFWSKQWGTKMV